MKNKWCDRFCFCVTFFKKPYWTLVKQQKLNKIFVFVYDYYWKMIMNEIKPKRKERVVENFCRPIE